MKESTKKHLQENPKLRKRLRVIGVILTVLGGIFMLIAFIDFFSAFNNFGEPSLFWMFFLGMFTIFPGVVCLQYGFMGSVARYQASEIAPVAKDTANYLLDGTRDELSKTIKEFRNSDSNKITCPKCKEQLDKDSSFCNHCGNKLQIECKKCNTNNDSDSKYCKKCGNELG